MLRCELLGRWGLGPGTEPATGLAALGALPPGRQGEWADPETLVQRPGYRVTKPVSETVSSAA